MRKAYLKIATQALVFGALLNELVKSLWLAPMKALLAADFHTADYRAAIIVGVHLAGLIIFYKLMSVVMLWGFDRLPLVRLFVDQLFDVEGTYLESVYINGELEVVGINHVAFKNGELKVDSELRWPKQNDDGTIALIVCARTTSVDDLCTASDKLLHYAFQDNYVEHASFDKTGVTKLTLYRERNPSRLTRLFRRTPIVAYSGGFSSYDNEIRGSIQGKRLTGDLLRDADGSDDKARERVLVDEVAKALNDGKKLRKEPPGVLVTPASA